MNYNNTNTVVIIPAYEPDEKLISLLQEIKIETNYDVLVINDGSSKEVSPIFLKARDYGEVIEHDVNKGKGEAIKSGLKYVQDNYKEKTKIVVIDCDGQHKVFDMMKVCEKIEEHSLIIGCRKFNGKIPFRSRFGNTITRYVFRLAAGMFVSDTQTGLRGFGDDMIPFLLNIKGNRYEYEMNVLLECAKNKKQIIEIPIETIYLENNKSSHFNPTLDSIRIYKDIIRFSCSSFISFIIDLVIYSLMIFFTGNLNTNISVLISNIVARSISSSINFLINRKYVFKNNSNILKSAIKYFSLAISILIMNTILLTFITENIIEDKIISKIIVEILLFIISWTVQKLFVFKNEQRKEQKCTY